MTKAQRAERDRAIVQDLQEGMSTKEAATKYGLNVERIRQIARQNGVPPTRRGRPKGVYAERNRAIVQDLREGMSCKEVATKYGLGTNWVNEIARQNGVPPPPPPQCMPSATAPLRRTSERE